jgi:ADP-ribose pyrophosphatase
METKVRTIASIKAASFSAHLDDVLLRNGEPGRRIRLEHPPAAAVVPLLSPEKIVMVRQYRYALHMETLEIPAGKVDPGEDPQACALRELTEETGYRSDRLQHVYTYAPAIGYADELIHIYAARRLEKVTAEIDEREIIATEILTLPTIRSMVKEGRILDGKTLIGLAFLKLL